MSFLYYNSATPEVDASFKNIKGENIFQKNPLSGEYERVGVGGSGGDLPYWVQSNRATIYDNTTRDNTIHDKTGYMVETTSDGTRQKSSLKKEGVTVDDEATSTGSLLTSAALVFGDAVDNSSYTKVGAKNLAEIGARIVKIDPVATDKLLLFDAASNAYRTTPWKDYLKPTSIEFSDTFTKNTVGASGSIITGHNSGDTLANYRKTSMSIGNKTGTTTTMDNSKAYVVATSAGFHSISGTSGTSASLKFGGVEIQKGGVLKTLTWDNLNELVSLYGKTATSSPTASHQMLLWNTVSKAYTYSPLPASTVLPDYLKPTSIELTDGTRNSLHTATAITLTDIADDGGFSLHTPATFALGKKLGAASTLDTSKHYIRIDPDSISINSGVAGTFLNLTPTDITFFKSGYIDGILNHDNVSELFKLNAKTSMTTPTAAERMLLFTPSTGEYRYSPVPASVTSTKSFYNFSKMMYVTKSSSNHAPLWVDDGSTLTLAGDSTYIPDIYNMTNTLFSGDAVNLSTTAPGELLANNTYYLPFIFSTAFNSNWMIDVSTNNPAVTACFMRRTAFIGANTYGNIGVVAFRATAGISSLASVKFTLNIINAGEAFKTATFAP